MRSPNGKTALLLGANDRAMFSMARQLLKKGFKVEVADWQPFPLDRSKYIHKYHRLSNAEKSVSRFAADLLKLLDENDYAFLIPTNDAALEICVNFTREISAKVNIIGLPSPENYIYSHDKVALLEKCREIGVPVPKTSVVGKIEDAAEALVALEFPLIIRPAYSKSIKNDRIYSFTVKQAGDSGQALDVIREHIENCPVMVQEKLGGHGAGFNFLAKDGEILSAYAHERLREPFEGGQSSYRKTVPADTYNLREYSEKLVRAINWTGIAMIEYRIDRGQPYIMEINGRLWGSIELGIFAGVNIPLQFLELFYENKYPQPSEAKSVRARNLKLDMRNALTETRRQRSILPFGKWLWSFRQALSSNEIIEDNPLRDLSYETAVYYGFARKAGKIFSLKPFSKREKNISSSPPLQKGMKIGFLCFGNICRSPFAEIYARRITASFEFSSYGFFSQTARLSPVFAVEAAKQFGVDLGGHRSKIIDEEAAEKLDIIFVMDEKNFADFNMSFPAYQGKVFYLDPQGDINDPYGEGKNIFVEVYRKIAETLDKLLTEHD